MKIESVDFHYLSMPEVTTAADGSQDALIVRVSAGGHVGWGECEAAPLPSIAAFVCPMSHGACRPVSEAVLGHVLDDPDDIRRIAAQIEYDSMDLLQAAHTWSGIEMALWDLLGKVRSEPVWRLLGYEKSYAKTPYASALFGSDPEETLVAAQRLRRNGFDAIKFGWAPFGASVSSDIEHLDAAREGLGPDGTLLIDAGQIFGTNVEEAVQRVEALERNGVAFLEEPFHGAALGAYAELKRHCTTLRIAGGEASHNAYMARHLIDYGNVDVIQIDSGRIGGLGPSKDVADYAVQKGVTYLNHTFTSNLALSASLQPFAGLSAHRLCEFPVAPRQLARDLTTTRITPNASGEINLPDAPGLGIEINPDALTTYAVDVEIEVNGKSLFSSRRRRVS
jgi:L-alanine-DL-glutamate epimerase-like enolase superfamily enzyme